MCAYLQCFIDKLPVTVLTGDGAFVTLILHVVGQEATLQLGPALVLTPQDLLGTVARMCLTEKKNMQGVIMRCPHFLLLFMFVCLKKAEKQQSMKDLKNSNCC